MNQIFLVDLDDLKAQLEVREGDKDIQYKITLSPDRKGCVIVREVWEIDGDQPIERREEKLTLDELIKDQSRPHHFVWAVRGMWGIPLEFGQGPSEDAETIEALKAAIDDPPVRTLGPSEDEPAPVPKAKRSR